MRVSAISSHLHDNNFGLLRLILAYCVIASHSPEMLDGNRTREPLNQIGSTITLGGLAVDGFFILSGYLVASSYLNRRSITNFLFSRILRIYPAFCVAYLVCIFWVGPYSGATLGTITGYGWAAIIAKMLLLAPPHLPNAFHTLPIPALDGAMWSIRYEFRCYLVLGILGLAGALDRRWFAVILTGLLYLFVILVKQPPHPSLRPDGIDLIAATIGDPGLSLSLLAIFMTGVCFRLFRQTLKFSWPGIFICAGFCVIAVLTSSFGELVFGILGTYVLLSIAMAKRFPIIGGINNKYDYSYGTYLYAWPIGSLILLASLNFGANISPSTLTIDVIFLATIAGAISWYSIERNMLKLKPHRNYSSPKSDLTG
jgi:peptidoglycan/LPS O-acetylase OafA/YrhL